jgi:hypothetical protein
MINWEKISSMTDDEVKSVPHTPEQCRKIWVEAAEKHIDLCHKIVDIKDDLIRSKEWGIIEGVAESVAYWREIYFRKCKLEGLIPIP